VDLAGFRQGDEMKEKYIRAIALASSAPARTALTRKSPGIFVANV